MTHHLLEWFETHWTPTSENSLFYRDLDPRRRELIHSKAPASSDNQFLVCSFYDDQNFIAIGDKAVTWHSDLSGGTIALVDISWFHRTGDIPDDRYADKELRFYYEGRVIERPEALNYVGKGVRFLRLSSLRFPAEIGTPVRSKPAP